MKDGIGQPQSILLAMVADGRGEFIDSDIAVVAWTAYPELFTLRGYPQHPDSNRVLAHLMGVRGLRSRGWVELLRPRVYRVTPNGRLAARRLRGEPAPTALPSTVSLDDAEFLTRLLDSEVVDAYRSGSKFGITFAMAMEFWRLKDDARGETVDEVVGGVRRRLQKLLGNVDRLVLPTGRVVLAGDVRALINVADHIEDRFARHLKLMRARCA